MNILTKLKQIDELERGATPGEWRSIPGDSFHAYPFVYSQCKKLMLNLDDDSVVKGYPGNDSDAAFIAQSRNAYPEMSEFIKETVKLIKRAENWADAIDCGPDIKQWCLEFLNKYDLTEKGDDSTGNQKNQWGMP